MNPKETGPEQLLAELREIRKRIPFFDDGTPTPDKLERQLRRLRCSVADVDRDRAALIGEIRRMVDATPFWQGQGRGDECENPTGNRSVSGNA